MQIEKSLQELQQLFVDMAMLVTEQGEMIDSVENNIENAISYVVQGKGQLKKANKWATRNRKVHIRSVHKNYFNNALILFYYY
jgi:syntaxin 1A